MPAYFEKKCAASRVKLLPGFAKPLDEVYVPLWKPEYGKETPERNPTKEGKF